MAERSLLFFRTSFNTLLSSMQSLESSFFLIALRRFPHALSTCASAFEIAIQGAAIDLGKDNRLQALIHTARNNSATIRRFPQDRLDQFRTLRNKIVHRGFTSKDNSAAVSLYLDVGLPLLAATYSDFYSFDLSDGLLQDFVEQLNLAQGVHRKAKSLSNHDLSLLSQCVWPLSPVAL